MRRLIAGIESTQPKKSSMYPRNTILHYIKISIYDQFHITLRRCGNEMLPSHKSGKFLSIYRNQEIICCSYRLLYELCAFFSS